MGAAGAAAGVRRVPRGNDASLNEHGTLRNVTPNMWTATRSLAEFPTRRNSLNALRLLLAALVVVSHASPIGGFGVDPRLGPYSLGGFSVAGFFAISGWLITQSRLSGTLRSFIWRRLVRIYPGYFAALLVVGFVFAPVGALLGGGSYSVLDGAHYVRVNLGLLIQEYNVGASLPDSAYPAWNGSLWTLFSEVACYAVVGLVVSLVGRRFTGPVVVALLVGTTLLEVSGVADGVPLLPGVHDFLSLSPFFFAGGALFVLRRVLPLGGIAVVVAAVLFGVVLVTSSDTSLGAVPIAYLLLWLGAVLPLQGVGRYHDISYGMYIYAFPVQQLLALAGVPKLGLVPYVLLGIAATVPFAAASWWLVERPAQRARGLLDGGDRRAGFRRPQGLDGTTG